MLKRLYVPDGRPVLTIRGSYQRHASSSSDTWPYVHLFYRLSRATRLFTLAKEYGHDDPIPPVTHLHILTTIVSLAAEHKSQWRGKVKGWHSWVLREATHCVCTQSGTSGSAIQKVACVVWLVSSHGHWRVVIHQQSIKTTYNIFSRIYHCFLMIFRQVRVCTHLSRVFFLRKSKQCHKQRSLAGYNLWTLLFATNQLKAQVGLAWSDRKDKAIYYFSNNTLIKITFQPSNHFHYQLTPPHPQVC